jgi:competence protein ComEA
MFAMEDTRAWWRRRAALAAVALAALLVAGAVGAGCLLTRAAPSVSAPPVPDDQPLDPATAPEALVFVSGAVVHPGLYRLSAAARISDAIAAAGGFTADADPGKLPNLASKVHDGRQVNVPFLRTSRSGTTTSAARLDLNTAGVDELRAVPGMPTGLPEAIVEARDLWGPFHSVSDLRTLLDVDAATLTGLRPFLRVVVSP